MFSLCWQVVAKFFNSALNIHHYEMDLLSLDIAGECHWVQALNERCHGDESQFSLRLMVLTPQWLLAQLVESQAIS